MSLPLWERGLKLSQIGYKCGFSNVAPLVGAWIEINLLESLGIQDDVAPLVGAWIEIVLFTYVSISKFVAPLVGAWIEIRPNTRH